MQSLHYTISKRNEAWSFKEIQLSKNAVTIIIYIIISSFAAFEKLI